MSTQRILIVLLYAGLFATLWLGRRRTRVVVGSIGLLAGLCLTWKLHEYLHQYYLSWITVSLDPLGLDYYPSPGTPAPAGRRDRPLVVFYGDSRAVEWPAPAPPVPGEFINRGVSGQTTTQVLQRFDRHVKPLRPDIVVLQVGINDLKTLPFFPDRKGQIIEQCKANIRRIVEMCVEEGATVVLSTIFPPGDVPLERRPFWSPEVPDAVRLVNQYLSTLRSDRVVIFDAYAILADRGYVRRDLGRDTLHIGTPGYRALNQELVKLLARIPNDPSVHARLPEAEEARSPPPARGPG
jgi:lysophospholipase L1-like esterase